MLLKSLLMIISNRELLREYKVWKEKLLSGEIQEIQIPQKGGEILQISILNKKTPFEKLCDMIEKKPLPKIERPKFDLFDEVWDIY